MAELHSLIEEAVVDYDILNIADTYLSESIPATQALISEDGTTLKLILTYECICELVNKETARLHLASIAERLPVIPGFKLSIRDIFDEVLDNPNFEDEEGMNIIVTIIAECTIGEAK